jgi:acid phosphatase (class A)
MKNFPQQLVTLLALGVSLSLPTTAQVLIQPTDAAPNATPYVQKPMPKFNYLPADFLANPALIVPAPPKPDSLESKLDLEAAKATQARATPERIALAARDDEVESVWLFDDVMPSGFTAQKLPVTEKLFKALRVDENNIGNIFKIYFARSRPFDVDHSVKTCVPETYGKVPRSYPSGHAILGYSFGVVLAHLIPEKADIILARSKVYGDSRVVCGVHFASDIVASQTIATAVALELLKNPAFKADFDAAKAELIAAGFTK